MQQHTQTLPPGTILHGNSYTYRIDDILGQGSFGITYLATTRVKVQGDLGELETEIQVAIKEFFLKEMSAREATGMVTESSQGSLAQKYGQKFLKEAENLSRLKHPNIIRVLEVFSTNNTHYFVMEYIKGSSLDDYIKEWNGLPEKEAIDNIHSIGNALSYMHSRKMLHLDLKPKNIMRRNDGCLYLIDFGLSKQYDTQGEPESSTTIGLGTPGYAPLEQGNIQEEKDFAATLDVYALGATLYKTLTAKTPPNASVVMNDGFPEEELLKRDISEQTINAIQQAMAPQKKKRPQSVRKFLELLDKTEEKKWMEKKTQPEEEDTTLVVEKEIEKKELPHQKQPFSSKKRSLFIGATITLLLAIAIWFTQKLDDTTPVKEVPLVTESLATEAVSPTEGNPVALGLSVKWAAYNIGASFPEECGGLYGWADPTGKKESANSDDYPSANPPSNISGTQYDIARAQWGEKWRLPTQKELLELSDKCTWKWMKYKKTDGYMITGPNGNRIFLPSHEGTIFSRGNYGDYWSGTLGANDFAYYLYFDSISKSPSYENDRNFKHFIRPVSE